MLTLLQANTADLLIQEAAAPEKMSLIKMAVAGGWLMIVLLILSIIAIYILGNRSSATASGPSVRQEN